MFRRGGGGGPTPRQGVERSIPAYAGLEYCAEVIKGRLDGVHPGRDGACVMMRDNIKTKRPWGGGNKTPTPGRGLLAGRVVFKKKKVRRGTYPEKMSGDRKQKNSARAHVRGGNAQPPALCQ